MATKINGGTQIQALTITNAEIATAANIALSKLAEAVLQADGGQTFTGNQDAGSFKITNLGAPTNANDAARLVDIQNSAAGLDVRASVRVATIADGSFATDFENGVSVDGVVLVTGNRILIKDQATGSQNGIYTVNASGAPTRATDADTSAEVTPNMFVFVEEGTVNQDTGWVLTTNATITLGSTALVFTQFTGAAALIAGAGLTKTGNQIDVVSGNNAIVANANDITLTLDSTPGLQTTSGLKILLAASSGLNLTSGLAIDSSIAGNGLTFGSGVLNVVSGNAAIVANANDITLTLDSTPGLQTTTGLKILLAANSALTLASGLAVASSIAGAGLIWTTGVLSIDASSFATSHHVFNETPTGLINSSNLVYTIAASSLTDTEQVYLNGILQQPGAVDYTRTNATTFTFATAPVTGSVVKISYMK